MAKPPAKSANSLIGWREHIGLPDLSIASIRAKIDTGARTSAVHATDRKVINCNGEKWVEFHVPVRGEPRSKRCAARIVDERKIKNTSGVPETRYIIETTLVLGARRWRIELSLANREEMGFELILGRTAIRNRKLLVDPGRSFLAGQPSAPPAKAHAAGPVPHTKTKKKRIRAPDLGDEEE